MTTTALATTTASDDAEERYRGCGWFESSEELADGLLVIESREPELVLEIFFPGLARTRLAAGHARGGCH